MAFQQQESVPVISPSGWNRSWTQLDLDLIRRIKDEYPCIYINDGGENRLTRIKKAWEEIGETFKDVPVTQLKTRWKAIREYYMKNRGKKPGLEYQKYFDGTLSFLDDELVYDDKDYDMLQQNEDNKDRSQDVTMVKKYGNTKSQRPSLDAASGSNIRQLIHEEIDIIDDNDIDIKVEVDADTEDANFEKAVEEMKRPDHDNKEKGTVDIEDCEPEHNWDEEELLNATRLTQEMVEALICIKTKSYYLAPTSSPRK